MLDREKNIKSIQAILEKINKSNEINANIYKSAIVSDPEEIKKRDVQLRKVQIENEVAESELELKKGICVWVKIVVSMYLLFIAFILGVVVFGFGYLDNSTIIALLTTTTINILGLPYMIVKSLFPSKK